ncbi:hypothetical protein HAX54_009166, partial [Datura stramonium]|nr:hypothetical protein [Datura stramonium]
LNVRYPEEVGNAGHARELPIETRVQARRLRATTMNPRFTDASWFDISDSLV